MRKIKFRGKRVDNGEWVHGFLLNGFKDEIIIGMSYDRHTLEVDIDYGDFQLVIPETVGQFIGHQDKNGVDAYEGDKCDVVYDGDVDTYEYVIKDIRSISNLKGSSKDFEIVGNIHDDVKPIET